MPKYTYPGLAAAATVLLMLGAAAPATAAPATIRPLTADTLTVGSTTGANVAVGDKLSAALSVTSTLSTSAGSLTCTAGSFTATVASNNATTATENVTGFNLTPSSCTSSIIGTTSVKSVGLTSGTSPLATVTASTSKLTVTPSVTVVLNTVLGLPVTCIYSGAATGTLSNTTHSLAFSGVAVTKQTGSSSVCPSSGTFGATYAPVLDLTQAGGTVYVN
jgi:hypothetical protein